MTQKTPRVLAAGDVEHWELSPALKFLAGHCPLTIVPDLGEAAGRLRAGSLFPAAVVVAQSRPGQYSPDAAEELFAAAPLARPVVLLGSWCEGEVRTGRPWPGVSRVYWHARGDLLAAVQSAGVPRTETPSEHWLARSCVPVAGNGLVVIGAARLLMYESLALLCSQAGYSSTWARPGQPNRAPGAQAGVWQGEWASPGGPRFLADFCQALHPAPVIALLHFPRAEDVSNARQRGAREVSALPLDTTSLLESLRRLARG